MQENMEEMCKKKSDNSVTMRGFSRFLLGWKSALVYVSMWEVNIEINSTGLLE